MFQFIPIYFNLHLALGSESAVNIFREILAKHDRVSARVDYAQALCRWANGCFKVSLCLSQKALRRCPALPTWSWPTASCAKQTMPFKKWRISSRRGEFLQSLSATQGYPASKVLGRAVLVRGVAKMVCAWLEAPKSLLAEWATTASVIVCRIGPSYSRELSSCRERRRSWSKLLGR